MKAAPLFFAFLLALSGCVTAYDCGMQADDAMSFDACRQTKGSPAYRYCTDNHRYENFAACARHATQDGAALCLSKRATRNEIHECLNGKGGPLITKEEEAKAKPLPQLKLEPDPMPSRGNGQFVTGVIFTAAGPALGLLVYASGKSLDCSKDEDEEKQAECEDQKAGAPANAIVFAGLGLGVGLPLLFDGIEKRRAYKEWRDRHPEARAALKLNLTPLAQGGLAALLTLDLD